MKFGTDEQSKALDIGHVPIIFVVRSMGGLVVKKAFILGQNDAQFKDIIQSISGIIFLGTPHRGSNLAQVLNRVLQASVFNHSAKEYITELQRNSSTLQDINDQFRNFAADLSIVSFFETRPTAVGPRKMMIVERDSATLGYVGEITKALDADHHDLSKYFSREDPKYRSFLGNTTRIPQILWVKGPPGAGKSVLSAFIVQHLRSIEAKCQFYFFRHGNPDTRSVSGLLKSLTFQLASQLPDYRHRLTGLAETGFSAQKVESRVLWQKLFVQMLFEMDVSFPLFWVIDGLDEAESPQVFLNFLVALSNSDLPLRLIVMSRETQPLTASIHRLTATINVQKIPLDASVQDVRLYIEQEIELVHAPCELKAQISNTIMTMAAGNFLWVHLVLKEIMICISEVDIERALKGLPPELEPLYARIDESVAGQIRAGDLNLAKTILAWVICSRRPLVLEELSRALHPEYRPIDLSHTVKRVCGEFIRITSKGNVTMIHDTAREYLTKTPEAHLHISTPEAHSAIFRKCISNLLTTSPRIRANFADSQPFLLYTATSWPYHLDFSTAYCDRVALVQLEKFLLSRSVLAWIECLAIVGELRVLVHASEALTRLLEKSFVVVDSEQSRPAQQLQGKDLLKQWAVDLMKIVGKFGSHLAAYPRSIYKLIPSFCPHDSILRRCFAQWDRNTPGSTLRLSGFSNKSWDDNLATFSVRHDSQPIVVRALDNHFAILIADGMVILYHALTFQEWDDVVGEAHFRDYHHNSPKSASFNQGGTQVALAYRGFPLCVWDVDFPGFVGRCERPGHGGELIWTEVDKVGWNPITGHVFGTYTDSHLFKWHPIDHDYHELSVPALNIACSRDGNLLLTTSGDGTLRVWNFHQFAMIYQLSCNTPMTDISFDPEGRRIYDLRDSYCNVWEPNCLVKYAETDGGATETSSFERITGNSSMVSEMSSEMLEPITALALNRVSSAYCAGNDGGLVTFSAAGSEEPVELCQGFMSVEHIVWSADGKSLATSDLSARVTVKVFEGPSMPTARTVLQTSPHDGIQQILLSPSGSHLLVYTRQSAQLWSVDTKSVVASVPRPNRFIRWVDHDQPDLLLCFGFSDVRLFRWNNLEEINSFSINRSLVDDEHQSPVGDRPGPFRLDSLDWVLEASDVDSSVDKIFRTPDGSALLVQTSQVCDHHRRRKQFMVLKMNALAADNPVNEITASPLPLHMRERIEIPLGFLGSQGIQGVGMFSHGHPEAPVLAFLDKDFWVCTGLLNNQGEVHVKKFFFLPRDWLNIESLELAAVTREGVLICPRNGEIGVVTGGLKDEWIE
ncbi:hypothetical protein KVR01_011679 [Diaporthe batatas]|uniref:uncharacterized protein n=1 Tax=Diaporthe batatas TaxID=748121 RepID=UPI001D03AE2B|nr:uncharacterized protein KVR01_011679 [Diaporthe batatas]KAG8158557.1 hypothetical protein KVR01_011679 [Diaporthe batatas]